MEPKYYYSHYVANDKINKLNIKLAEVILSYHPKSILEFGCGQAKNLYNIDIVDHLG